VGRTVVLASNCETLLFAKVSVKGRAVIFDRAGFSEAA